MQLPVYLDYHATTPVDPRVLEAMTAYFTKVFGNPASRGHVFGWEAEAAVDAAREQVARAMNAAPREIVFTSGATESDNLAILGVARLFGQKEKGGPDDHGADGALGGPRLLPAARAGGLRDHVSRSREVRRDRSRARRARPSPRRPSS